MRDGVWARIPWTWARNETGLGDNILQLCLQAIQDFLCICSF